MISICMDGNISSLAFLLKILFTALTLGCGYKGGEIVPTFFHRSCFLVLCLETSSDFHHLCAQPLAWALCSVV